MCRGKETRALSLDSSPVASSRVSVSSRDSLSKPDGDGLDHDALSQVSCSDFDDRLRQTPQEVKLNEGFATLAT